MHNTFTKSQSTNSYNAAFYSKGSFFVLEIYKHGQSELRSVVIENVGAKVKLMCTKIE